MDWRRVIQFARLGSSDFEQYAILLVRVSIGLFFAISGANKLFVAATRQTMYETLVKAKVPSPHLMAYFVSGVEFLGGSVLIVGFLSSVACVALLVDMLVAILTTKLSATPKGLSALDWLDDFLYLPEVLYVLFFIWLICSGPGRFSVDYWLAGKLLVWSTKRLVGHHLILAGSWLITATPASLTISSWESVPPEQPTAPIMPPWSISGIPPRDAMIPSNASR
jgi:putative oxidoreductase